MPKYIYRVDIEFDAIDDIDARMIIKHHTKIDNNFNLSSNPITKKKLQRLKDGKPPKGVEIL